MVKLSPSGNMTELDRAVIDRLAHTRSELGYLSLYEAVEFEQPDRWRQHARARLAKMHVNPARPHAERQLIRGAIDRMVAVIDDMPIRTTSFRGLVGFVDLEGADGDLWIALDHAVECSLDLASRPRIAPLLPLLEAAAETGVVRCSTDSVVVDEWRAGAITEIASYRADVDTSQWRRKQGPASVSGLGQESVLQEDRFRSSLNQHRVEQLIDWVGDTLQTLHTRHRWQRMVIFGPAGVVDMLRPALAFAEPIIDGGHGILVRAPHDELGAHVHRALEGQRAERDKAVVTRLLETGPAEAIIGSPQTETALDEGRIDTLLLSDEDGDGSHQVKEYLIRRAFDTSSEVVVVTDLEAVHLLLAAGGIGGLLRY